MGDDFSWDSCTSSGQTDVDYDGIGDFCEFQLSVAFRPMLSTSPTDPALAGEPYWAVGTNGSLITVVYMFGYYEDPGVSSCFWSPPVGCTPHHGDNEFVVLNLGFDPDTQHWVVASQFFSAHWGCLLFFPGTTCDYSENVWWGDLEYPTSDSSYTRVYVADRKHANYKSRTACNAGAVASSDDCTNNADSGRLYVGYYRNVGSAFAPMKDETFSTVSPVSRPGKDYFWQTVRFCGWAIASGSREPCSPTSYAKVLDEFMYGF